MANANPESHLIARTLQSLVVSSYERWVEAAMAEAAELILWSPPHDWRLKSGFAELGLGSFEDIRIAGSALVMTDQLSERLAGLDWPAELPSFIRSKALRLVSVVEAAFPGTLFEFRLEHFTDDACRRFHQDNTDWRFLLSLRGAGTEWIDRSRPPPQIIHRLKPFEHGLFRGRRTYEEGMILHRSPPIEGSGTDRLLLVIDIERPGWRGAA